MVSIGSLLCHIKSEQKSLDKPSSKQVPHAELKVPGCTHRSFWGRGKPSRAQEMVGVGVPEAMHFRETLGPGVSVWLMNLYSSSGGEAVRGE